MHYSGVNGLSTCSWDLTKIIKIVFPTRTEFCAWLFTIIYFNLAKIKKSEKIFIYLFHYSYLSAAKTCLMYKHKKVLSLTFILLKIKFDDLQLLLQATKNHIFLKRNIPPLTSTFHTPPFSHPWKSLTKSVKATISQDVKLQEYCIVSTVHFANG
jgi:hypothetical protein